MKRIIRIFLYVGLGLSSSNWFESIDVGDAQYLSLALTVLYITVLLLEDPEREAERSGRP
jgi:hypothetical protein